MTSFEVKDATVTLCIMCLFFLHILFTGENFYVYIFINFVDYIYKENNINVIITLNFFSLRIKFALFMKTDLSSY